jgi:hypothetical protein
MNEVMEGAESEEILLFVDIDAIPLNREVLILAMETADAGGIFGCAQSANHLERARFVYAGPMFLALKKRTWLDLNRPSFQIDADFDAGMRLSTLAFERGTPVRLLYPNVVCIPKWALADSGVSGTGTFYEGKVFHLFESRKAFLYIDLFSYVTGSVLEGRGIDYLRAIALANGWRVKIRKRLFSARDFVYWRYKEFRDWGNRQRR